MNHVAARPTFVAVLVAVFALPSVAAKAVDKSGGSRAVAVKPAKPAKAAATASGRMLRATRARPRASIGQEGLCQRDTGTPLSSLDFRNSCDVEEFWRRQDDRGSAGED